MYKESNNSNTATNSNAGLGTNVCKNDGSSPFPVRTNLIMANDDVDGEGELVSPSLTSSPDFLTSSSACSSLQSSQSTSPLPPLSPTSPSMMHGSSYSSHCDQLISNIHAMTLSVDPQSVSSTSTSNSSTAVITIPASSAFSGTTGTTTTTKRRYRLAKKRTMPPRSNSTPLPPDTESSNVASSCPNSATGSGGSGSFSSRMSRFAYSESLQRRIISSFLRQNSAEDVTTTGKKKSGSKGVVDVDAVSVPPLDEIKASSGAGSILRNSKALSLSNIKSSSVPSIVKRADSKDSPSKTKDASFADAEQSLSRRNTGETVVEKPFLLMNYRARPKLSTLTNEPNMRSTVGGCGYNSTSPTSNTTSTNSTSLTSIPAIVVNECDSSGGTSPAPGELLGDETAEDGKLTDGFK